MTSHQLPIQERHPLSALPPAIADLGEDATRAFLDFFTAQIRNPNTRAAYFRNAVRFLAWIDVRGVKLREVQAFHVSAYIEELMDTHSSPTVKQHLATLRMLGTFPVVRQVLPTNPAADVRGSAASQLSWDSTSMITTKSAAE